MALRSRVSSRTSRSATSLPGARSLACEEANGSCRGSEPAEGGCLAVEERARGRARAAELALGRPFDATWVLAPLVVTASPLRPQSSRDKLKQSPCPRERDARRSRAYAGP